MDTANSKLSGWLVIDKPSGLTSHTVVSIARRALSVKRIGHLGTLDPLATGVLPLMIGRATSLASYVVVGRKQYYFTIIWGERRDTADQQGQVIAQSNVRPSLEEICSILPQFHGCITQIPPQYSAIKVKGKPAYKLARSGNKVEIAARKVNIFSLKCIKSHANNLAADFVVTCSKGTYIRSLAEDIAKSLGGLGYVGSLRRSFCAPFCERDAISLDKLEEMGHSAVADPVRGLVDTPAYNIDEHTAWRLRCGQRVVIENSLLPETDGMFSVFVHGNFAGLVERDGILLRPKVMF